MTRAAKPHLEVTGDRPHDCGRPGGRGSTGSATGSRLSATPGRADQDLTVDSDRAGRSRQLPIHGHPSVKGIVPTQACRPCGPRVNLVATAVTTSTTSAMYLTAPDARLPHRRPR